MKAKTKLFTAALIGCTLVLLLTASAGCIGSIDTEVSPTSIPTVSPTLTPTSIDPIVGVWKCYLYSGTVIEVEEFKSDGLQITTIYDESFTQKNTDNWVKVGQNHYRNTNSYDYYLNSAGTQLTQKIIDYQGREIESTYVRSSANEIANEIKKKYATSSDLSQEPILGAWKFDDGGKYITYYEFKSDGSYDVTGYSKDSKKIHTKVTWYWEKLSDKHYRKTGSDASSSTDYYLDSTGTKLSEIRSYANNAKMYENVYIRISPNEIPS